MSAPALSAHRLGLQAGSKVLCRDLDFALRPGDFVALLGRNGTGKTTLLKTLAGLRVADSGTIRLGGENIRDIPARRRALALALLLSPRLGDDSLRGWEFAALGRWPHTPWHGALAEADKAVVRRALESADALHLRHGLLGRLSDGEKQKLGLARVLAQEAAILLLDEPLSHLDAPSRLATLETLRRLAGAGKAVLFSCHDLDLAFRVAAKLLILFPGGYFLGSPSEAAARADCRAALGLDAAPWLLPEEAKG